MAKKFTDIEEIIADAKAEEEVAAEQAKAAKEEKAREDFRDTLREQLKDALITKKDEAKITIPIKEYILLKQKEMDLDRLLNAIVSGVYLGYSKDELRVNGERIIEVMRVLYPEVYDGLLAAEIDAQREGE